ncbi:hypothetical protein PROFUN_07744 [Planoprotostelium fungivorum]|uniref:Uncharacterized protein n=1 Tax=Planoprotostelium fungivorum TaxID=1890364 RepID=A0A2P6N1G0_9EUKA|nr:hypothetical protein PROFUN_07744 [Planoprotostelium fungivorum]
MSETTANTTSLGALWRKTLSKDPSLLDPVGINEPISNRRNILRNSAGSQLKSKFAYHLECLLEYGDKGRLSVSDL